MLKTLRYVYALLFFIYPLLCRDVLVEFKTAYFLPTDSCVRAIYGKGGALYGPEATFQLCENDNWYGFASVDFLSKKGHSVGLCEPTKMYIAPLALGVKYFVPFCYGDFYAGLGFQALHLKTVNCSSHVAQITSKWGFGGIAKIGAYCELPCNYFVDLFFDYSFAKVGCDKCSTSTVPLKVSMNGAIFGIGLGYRFN
ncbi:MAG: hypothetical protein WC707_06180 [Candidatus Babeliaceae bacterium]|jgi:hypothetical protein